MMATRQTMSRRPFDNRAEYKWRHRIAGLCVECSERAATGSIRCYKHLATHREQLRADKVELRAKGRCEVCGGPKMRNTTRCGKCTVEAIERNLRRRREKNNA